MSHITNEEILHGLKTGIVRIIDASGSPYYGDGIACEIGSGGVSNWFYFAGIEGEDTTAAEYLRNVPLEDIASEIVDALEDFEVSEDQGEHDEWLFYRTVLDENK